MTNVRPNICFHGIGTPQRELEPGENAYWITESTFLGVLDAIVERRDAGHDVAISFDDGNLSDVQIGLPALTERGLTASFFVLAGRLEDSGSLHPEHLHALRAAGMTIGTHGMRHIPWRGLDTAARFEEWVTAREILSDTLGVPVTTAALPLGRYDRVVLGQLRSLGYGGVYSSDRAWANPNSWLQPRFSVRAQDTVASFSSEALTPPSWLARNKSGLRTLVKRLR